MSSPLKGVVVKRSVEPGAVVNSGDVIATLADPKQLWFLGNVFEQDFRLINQGQKMVLQLEAYLDTDDLLRPDMYASASLTTGTADAVVVPQ